MSFKAVFKKISILLGHSFPVTDYLSLDPIAVDISPLAIRILRLKKTTDGYIPILHKEVGFKDPKLLTGNDVRVEDIQDVIDVLKKLKKEFKLKYVIASLPEDKNYIYRISLPHEAVEDVASAIRFTIEENVPLSVGDVNFDYKVLQVGERKLDAVVSVFPKSFIKVYSDILKKSGLYPISFQSESVALAHSVVADTDKNLYLLIRMMDDRVNVSVVENGAVQYTSTVFVKSADVTSDLKGVIAKQLSQELNKVLIYWFTSKKDAKEQHKIEKGIVVGKAALTEGFVDFLEDNLKIDVEIGDVWVNCFSADKYMPELTKEESSDFAVSVGLALKGVRYK